MINDKSNYYSNTYNYLTVYKQLNPNSFKNKG